MLLDYTLKNMKIEFIRLLTNKENKGCLSKSVYYIIPGIVSIQEIEEQILSMMINENGTWMCTVCGKCAKSKTDISRHIDSLHIVDHPGYNCENCGNNFRSKASLRSHNMKHCNKYVNVS